MAILLLSVLFMAALTLLGARPIRIADRVAVEPEAGTPQTGHATLTHALDRARQARIELEREMCEILTRLEQSAR